MNHFQIFKTRSGSQYLYDAPTGTVHPWPVPLGQDIAHKVYGAATDDELDVHFCDYALAGQTLRYLKLWRNSTPAFRTPHVNPQIHLTTFADAPLSVRGKIWMSDMILNVSEECNLRCEYCGFSPYYEALRNHSKISMSWEVARKAIDLFFFYNNAPVRHAYSDRLVNIVFYGGEPLLNRHVVKRAIEYALAQKASHYRLVLSVSTNLTAIQRDDIIFFRDNHVFLNASLDGPQAEHDRYRHFRNGRTTFGVVYSNLMEIRSFDKDYYDTYVRVIPTITGNTDIKAVYDFFEQGKDTLPRIQTVSLLRDLFDCEFHKAHPIDRDWFRNRISLVCDEYFERKIQGEQFSRGDFLYALIDECLEGLFQRQHARTTNPDWCTATCMPGRKISVAVDGTIHMCERICEDFPIGGVESGLDDAKIIELANKYFASTPGCGQCWARRQCNVCHAAVGEFGRFNFATRCEGVRKDTLANLELLFSILERRVDAFAGPDGRFGMVASRHSAFL